MQLQEILGYISQTQLLGFIPLDIIAHIIVGLTIAAIALKLQFKSTSVFIIVLIAALFKEYLDLSTLGPANTTAEHFKDIFFTIIPVSFLLLWLKAKSQVYRSQLNLK